jgi:hypothetical protein
MSGMAAMDTRSRCDSYRIVPPADPADSAVSQHPRLSMLQQPESLGW